MRRAFSSSLCWPRSGTFTKVPIGGHALQYWWALSNHAMSDKKWGRQGRQSGPAHEHVGEARSFLGEEDCLREKTSPPNSGRHRHFCIFYPLGLAGDELDHTQADWPDWTPFQIGLWTAHLQLFIHTGEDQKGLVIRLPLQCFRELVSREQTGPITNWRAYLRRGWGCGAMSQRH